MKWVYDDGAASRPVIPTTLRTAFAGRLALLPDAPTGKSNGN
jgi:hypothetical protein